MKHTRWIPAAALMAVALPAPVVAQEAEKTYRGGIYSAVILTSDYRFQGVSASDNHAAVQGYAHYHRPDGWYAGVFASQVDFNDFGTSYELDPYVGRNWDLKDGKTRLKAEAMASLFLDNRTPGPTYDFVQFKLAAERKDGPLTVRGSVSFTPSASYGSGQARLAVAEAEYALGRGVTFKGLAGRRWIERGQDRSFWNLAAAAKWKHLTFEIRYQDTDLSKRQCGFNPDICGASVGGSITAELRPILFMR